MKRNTTVTLEVAGVTRVFATSHAERILGMRNNGGWKLPEDSQFKFNVKDGITFKPDNGASEKSKKDISDQ